MQEFEIVLIVSDLINLYKAVSQLYAATTRKDFVLVVGLILGILLPIAHLVQLKDYQSNSVEFLPEQMTCKVLSLAGQVDLFSTSFRFVCLIKWNLSCYRGCKFDKKCILTTFLVFHLMWYGVLVAFSRGISLKQETNSSNDSIIDDSKLCHFAAVHIKHTKLIYIRDWAKSIFNAAISSFTVIAGSILIKNQLRTLKLKNLEINIMAATGWVISEIVFTIFNTMAIYNYITIVNSIRSEQCALLSNSFSQLFFTFFDAQLVERNLISQANIGFPRGPVTIVNTEGANELTRLQNSRSCDF